MGDKGEEQGNSWTVRIALIALGIALLAAAALLLVSPPRVDVPSTTETATAKTVSVDANYETAAIASGIAGCFLVLLGALNLRPVGFNVAGAEVNFDNRAEEVGRRPGNREELAERAALELEGKPIPTGASTLMLWNEQSKAFEEINLLEIGTEPVRHLGVESEGETVASGDENRSKDVEPPELSDEAKASLKEISLDEFLTINSRRHWDRLFPWVREVVEDWAVENGSDISVDPSTRIIGAQRLGEGSGNFAWKVDVLSDSGEIISLRATQGRGGRRLKELR